MPAHGLKTAGSESNPPRSSPTIVAAVRLFVAGTGQRLLCSGGMITFRISRVGASWEVRRNGRLLCYFSSFPIAHATVHGYMAEIQAHGGTATLFADDEVFKEAAE